MFLFKTDKEMEPIEKAISSLSDQQIEAEVLIMQRKVDSERELYLATGNEINLQDCAKAIQAHGLLLTERRRRTMKAWHCFRAIPEQTATTILASC